MLAQIVQVVVMNARLNLLYDVEMKVPDAPEKESFAMGHAKIAQRLKRTRRSCAILATDTQEIPEQCKAGKLTMRKKWAKEDKEAFAMRRLKIAFRIMRWRRSCRILAADIQQTITQRRNEEFRMRIMWAEEDAAAEQEAEHRRRNVDEQMLRRRRPLCKYKDEWMKNALKRRREEAKEVGKRGETQKTIQQWRDEEFRMRIKRAEEDAAAQQKPTIGGEMWLSKCYVEDDS